MSNEHRRPPEHPIPFSNAIPVIRDRASDQRKQNVAKWSQKGMTAAIPNFESGQRLRLVRAVEDDETGYRFATGSNALFSEYLSGKFFLIELEKSLGDCLDSGNISVMVCFDDIESA
jgi:hypothetical protein